MIDQTRIGQPKKVGSHDTADRYGLVFPRELVVVFRLGVGLDKLSCRESVCSLRDSAASVDLPSL